MSEDNEPRNLAVVNTTPPFRIEDHGGIAKLFLHGTFKDITENTRLISELHGASENFDVIEVWISSEGGVVTLLNELIEALKQFNTVVTICNSRAASAGAMIWGIGDVRVVAPFSQLLWHRESYGFFGKTNQHEDQIEHHKKLFPVLMNYCVGDVLTDEEIEKAKYTEIHKTGQEIIDGGHAISYEDYKARMDVAGSRFTEVGVVYHDCMKQQLILSDNSGSAKTIAYMDTSSYEYSLFDIAISDTVRITTQEGDGDDDVQETIIPLNAFEKMESQYVGQFGDEQPEEPTEEDNTNEENH